MLSCELLLVLTLLLPAPSSNANANVMSVSIVECRQGALSAVPACSCKQPRCDMRCIARGVRWLG